MQNFVKAAMTMAIALVVVLTTTPNCNVNAQNAGVISAILNKMERNYKDLKSLRAAISMERYDAQIGSKDKSSGAVIYIPAKGRNANVRVDWTSPQKETLSVVDGKYLLCRERLKQCYEGNGKSARGKGPGSALDFLNMSGSQIKASYEFKDIYEETLWGGVASTHFKLVPKGNVGYQYAEVWVDSYGMPVQSKVVEKNNDATTIRLLDIERNAKISIEDFKQKTDGYKIVKT
jgi:outer membrane lipoprotein-sorting protein